jgi:uncharacterized protein (DUF1501 family)
MSAHRACNDFHLAGEATRRRFARAPLTRRQAIAGGIGAGLAVYAAQAMPFSHMLEAAHAQAASAPDAPILVSVFLPGGLDLLEALPPGTGGRLADMRPGLRVADAVPLGGTGLGMHPALAQGANGGVRGLFDRGQIGFLPGIDYANPDLSHFHSRHFWETGLVTTRAAAGWLGRWLDANGSRDNPLQGVSMSGQLSPVLRSTSAPVAAVASPGAAQLHLPSVWGEAQVRAMAAWSELTAPRQGAGPGAAAALEKGRLAKDIADRLLPYIERDGVDPLAPPVAYPEDNDLGERLENLAGLLSQPLGVRVAAVQADGDFDTHDNQAPELARALGEVSEALSAFQADLEARGLAQRVLTFVWSEFGRRPQQNDSDGTDHGAGGIAWVQGPRARSGVLTDYPDLGRLDDEGNLAVTIDFRRVYTSLIEQWLGTDAGQVIPNAGAFGRVGLVA